MSHREAFFNAIGPALLTGAGAYLLFRLIGWPKRREPEQEPESPRSSMTREEMIAGLKAMVDDPDTPAKDRERALQRLWAFEKLE